MENQETKPDPLDLPSGVFVREDYCEHTFDRELTFRQLHDECWTGSGRMKLFDSLGRSLRLKNEQANDPHYKPIQPMEGMKKLKPRHRWWRLV